jgi:hypothetical protein
MRRAAPILLALCLWPASAAAAPASFAHGTIDSRLTTTKPNTATGGTWDAVYHAANDAAGDPPYMRRMVFYEPAGMRRDTSVPAQCTAGDVELALRGPDACPAASKIGQGSSTAKFMGEPSEIELVMFNNTNEQIILARSPLVTTIARGKIHPDGSIEFASPTCYPSVPGVSCPVDSVLQVRAHMAIPLYRDPAGRSYITTPPKCPKAGYWQTSVHFWWADGTEDRVVTKQRCSRPSTKTKRKRRAQRRS